MTRLSLTILVFLFSAMNLHAQVIDLVPFATGLVKPVDIKHCGDSRLFVVERDGYIRILDTAGNVNPVPFLDINSSVGSVGGEQGLLGMAFSPNYETDGYFYINYTDNNGDTRISRLMVDSINPDSAIAASEELLLKVLQPYTNHNGGNLQFGHDGYLYIGLGDGGSAGDPDDRAQTHKEYLGKMLRIDVSNAPGYTVPNDNPFLADTTYYPEIWASGLRNPWKYSFDHINGSLWIGDVGQGVWEEINIHHKNDPGGQNFGWRCYEGNAPYNTAGCLPASSYVAPIAEYQHSLSNGCSITGGYVYRGGEFNSLFGKYIYTDYCSGVIWSLTDSAGTYVNNTLGDFANNQYSTFGEDYFRELYIAETVSGDIYRLADTSCLPVAFIAETDTMKVCDTVVTLKTPAGNGFLYQWVLDTNIIPGANSSSYTTNQPGYYSVLVVNSSFCTNLSSPVYVEFHTPPAVTMDTLQNLFCVNITTVPLSGTPAGGMFYGKGVTGSNFSPALAGTGTHLITYKFTDPNGCSGTSSETVVVDACAFISQSPASGNISMIPNPNNGTFDLMLQEDNHGTYRITIADLVGKKVLEKEMEFRSGGRMQLSADLRPGLYILKATSEEGAVSYLKFLVQ